MTAMRAGMYVRGREKEAAEERRSKKGKSEKKYRYVQKECVHLQSSSPGDIVQLLQPMFETHASAHSCTLSLTHVITLQKNKGFRHGELNPGSQQQQPHLLSQRAVGEQPKEKEVYSVRLRCCGFHFRHGELNPSTAHSPTSHLMITPSNKKKG
jgi:hypothetical protein